MKKLLILLILYVSIPTNANSSKMQPSQQDLDNFQKQIELCHTTFHKKQKSVETLEQSTENFSQAQICYEKIATKMSEKYYADRKKISNNLSQLISKGLNVYEYSLKKSTICKEKECIPHAEIWKHYRVEASVYIFMENIRYYFQTIVL